MTELVVINAQELLEAKREGRQPVPEAVVDELPARFVARMERPPEIHDEEGAYDGREP